MLIIKKPQSSQTPGAFWTFYHHLRLKAAPTISLPSLENFTH